MKVRNPNTGPYVVSYIGAAKVRVEQECHTWGDACRLMRLLLVDNCTDIQVRFT